MKQGCVLSTSAHPTGSAFLERRWGTPAAAAAAGWSRSPALNAASKEKQPENGYFSSVAESEGWAGREAGGEPPSVGTSPKPLWEAEAPSFVSG